MAKNILKLEELEAIRPKDLKGMKQEECAAKMEISRPAFQRILISVREKIADSLINGKFILIEGENFTLNICPVRCTNCGKKWLKGHENLEVIKSGEYACPHCGANQIVCAQNCKGGIGHRNCRRYHSRD